MRGVWLFVDDKPIGMVTGRSVWQIKHQLGTKRFNRANSNKDYVLEWAQSAFVGVRFEMRWADTKRQVPSGPEQVYGDGDL